MSQLFKRVFFRIVPTVLAAAFGIVALLGVLLPGAGFINNLPAALITWASVLAAFALLAGFLNVMGVHLRRIAEQRHNWAYSVALLLGVIVVLAVTIIDALAARHLDPGGTFTRWLYDNVILQLEIAVGALIVFFLAFAGWRLLRAPTGGATPMRPVWGVLLFVFAALVVLLRAVTFITDPTLQSLQGLLIRIVDASTLGGARGLLIGVALGTIATGLRVLAGVDRPHSE